MTDPTKIPKAIREQFEVYAYRHYEASRMSAALQGEKVRAKLTREDFLAMEGGNYTNASTSMLWLGWKLCLDAQAPILEAANMWRQWAEQQERIAEQMPDGYTIMLCMERSPETDPHASGNWVDLVDDTGEQVEYADPEDLDSPGSIFRIIDAALAAAKAHAALKLN